MNPANTPGTEPFSTDKIYTYLKGYFSALDWTDALNALAFARRAHGQQLRKSGEPYILHPLTVTSHCLALGIKDQAVATTCLLHDVCEDCGVKPEELPVDDPIVKDAVRRLTHVKTVPLDVYYNDIAGSPVASLAKILDRCDNVSTMAGVFTDGKTLSYAEETRRHVMPLWRATKNNWPQYSSALFVLKYHIMSVISGLERTIPDEWYMPVAYVHQDGTTDIRCLKIQGVRTEAAVSRVTSALATRHDIESIDAALDSVLEAMDTVGLHGAYASPAGMLYVYAPGPVRSDDVEPEPTKPEYDSFATGKPVDA